MRTSLFGLLAASLLVSCLSPKQPQPQHQSGVVSEVAPVYAPPPAVDAVAPTPAPAGPLVSDASLRAVVEAGVHAGEDEGEVEVDGFIMLLVVEEIAGGSPLAPTFTRTVDGDGYRVTGVAPGSLYQRLGLREGDVVTTINDVPLTSPGRALMASAERSRRIALTIERDGVEHQQLLRVRPDMAWRHGERRTRHERRSPLAGILRGDRDRDSDSDSERASASPFPEVEEAPRSREIPGASEAITCEAGALRCTIDRAWVTDSLLKDAGGMARQARVVPAIRDGESRGFKLYGIRPGSIFKLMGFKNGDLIKRVGARSLTSLDEAMGLAEDFKTMREFDIELERKGEAMTLHLELR